MSKKPETTTRISFDTWDKIRVLKTCPKDSANDVIFEALCLLEQKRKGN